MESETEFLEAADAELNRLQDRIEAKWDDVDCTRSGNVLTIELENGAQVVVNIQTPMREIWLASHFGGYHFARHNGSWLETHGGSELETAAESAVSQLRG